MRRPGWLVVFVAALVAAGLGWLARTPAQTPSENPRSDPAADDRVAELEQENARLKASIERSRRREARSPMPSPEESMRTTPPAPRPNQYKDGKLVRLGDVVGVVVSAEDEPRFDAIARDASKPVAERVQALSNLRLINATGLSMLVDDLLRRPDEDPQVRLAALRGALFVARTDRTVSEIVRVLPDDAAAPEVERVMALQVLHAAEPAATRDRLRMMLESPVPDASRQALAALAGARDRADLDLLVDAVNRTPPPANTSELISTIARIKDRNWSTVQLTGRPDTPIGGDLATAWASKSQQMGEVWIELDYESAVRPESVRIHETHNPGAVARIEAWSPDSKWESLWEGTTTPRNAPNWFAPTLQVPSFTTRRIRLILDTNRVQGWNELDAVELIGDGRRQWAKAARASTCYADAQ